MFALVKGSRQPSTSTLGPPRGQSTYIFVYNNIFVYNREEAIPGTTQHIHLSTVPGSSVKMLSTSSLNLVIINVFESWQLNI